MIQLVINSNLLRELDERKLIRAYAKYCYEKEEDASEDNLIKQNLMNLLDWDINGDDGLGLYCGKFESLKRKDIEMLIQLIKTNAHEIKYLSYAPRKVKRLANLKVIRDKQEKQELRRVEHYTDENYELDPKGRGLPAKTCVYEGVTYKSRQECQYKNNLTRAELYKYLALTGQLDKDSPLAKKYLKNEN